MPHDDAPCTTMTTLRETSTSPARGECTNSSERTASPFEAHVLRNEYAELDVYDVMRARKPFAALDDVPRRAQPPLVAVLDSGYARTVGPLKMLPVHMIANHCAPVAGDTFGHGTLVIDFLGMLTTSCRVLPVHVFDSNHEATPASIERGIMIALERGARVIHMSLGTRDFREGSSLAASCHRAASGGVVLVASTPSFTSASFPAVFPCVIGVAPRADNPGIAVTIVDSKRAMCTAYSPRIRRDGVVYRAASLAAVTATAMICEQLARDTSWGGQEPAATLRLLQ